MENKPRRSGHYLLSRWWGGSPCASNALLSATHIPSLSLLIARLVGRSSQKLKTLFVWRVSLIGKAAVLKTAVGVKALQGSSPWPSAIKLYYVVVKVRSIKIAMIHLLHRKGLNIMGKPGIVLLGESGGQT